MFKANIKSKQTLEDYWPRTKPSLSLSFYELLHLKHVLSSEAAAGRLESPKVMTQYFKNKII